MARFYIAYQLQNVHVCRYIAEKRMNFNLRRIKVKLSVQRRKKLNVPCIMHDTQGLERLIEICRNLPLPISTHSRLLSILLNLAGEGMVLLLLSGIIAGYTLS